MRGKVKSFLAVLLMIVFTLSLTTLVFAQEAPTNYGSAAEVVQSLCSEGGKVPSSISTWVKAGNAPNADGYTSTYVGEQQYYWLKTNEQSIISAGNKQALKGKHSADDEGALQDFSDQIGDMGISADVEHASIILSGLTGVIRTLLGLIVVLISMGMTVFSGFDLCYIAFPVFRNKCEEAKQGGGGGFGNAMVKGGKNGEESKLRWVTDDAQYAVIAADTTHSGQNPFIIYFKKRFISYLVLAILLFILLTGRITIFTDLALKITSGIIEIIQDV